MPPVKKISEKLSPSLPSRRQALLFRVKALCFQLQRVWKNLIKKQKAHPKNQTLKKALVLACSQTALWPKNLDPREKSLIAGKVHNLRLAAQRLHGVEVPAGQTFSFWAQLGRLTRSRGYVTGREIREGCVIPSIGGGICQLSNALYDVALKAKFQIVERHAHSLVIPGSFSEQGRDATVFWNYVDLRFRSKKAFRLELWLSQDQLIVQLRGEGS